MSTTTAPPQFPVLARLLSSNAQWATDVNKAEPAFFEEGAKGQAPKVLWIGCADSRVPESVVTASRPGEIFVHRNIANQFHLDDVNANSVLEYAVGHLGVEHVIIVGHTKCGGVSASLSSLSTPPPHLIDPTSPHSPLNAWLSPLVSLASTLPAPDPLALVEASVAAQVEKLTQAEAVKAAWKKWEGKRGLGVWVHGWVYEVESGRIRDLGVSKGPGFH